MNTRIGFYIILTGLVGLLGFTAYRLFTADKSAVLESIQRTERSLSKKEPSRQSSVEKVDSNQTLRDPGALPKNLGDIDLKGKAEVSNNLQVLKDLYNRGEDEDLIAKLQKLIEEHPEVQEYAAFLGDYHYNEGNWPEAEKSIKRLVDLDPKNLFAKTRLGEVYAYEGRYDEAIQTHESVLSMDARNMGALQGYLLATDMKGTPEEGIRKIDSIVKSDPSNGNAAVVQAQIYMQRNQTEEAKKSLQNGMSGDPENSHLYREMAEVFQREGNLKESVKYAELAISKDKSPELKMLSLRVLWEAQFDQGNYEQAEVVNDQMLQLKPNDETALENQRMLEEAKQTKLKEKG